MPGDVSPLHGQGWLAPWQVERATPSEAILSYRHQAGEWPWDYRAEQHFELDPRGLSLRLTCRNLSAEPMPCGLGQHPYFNCGDATRIATEVTDVWTIDENVLPVEKVPATGRFALGDRLVCGQDLDHGFGGWGGRARLTDPGWPFADGDSRRRALLPALFTGHRQDLVAEPVTHANAALNAPKSSGPSLACKCSSRVRA